MARRAEGSIVTHQRADGLTTYSLRVTWRAERMLVRLGTEEDGFNLRRAERELRLTKALIEAGQWTPPSRQEASVDAGRLTIGGLVELYLEQRWLDLTEHTRADYRWRAGHHMVPLIGGDLVTSFNDDRFAWFKAELARRALVAAEAIDRGRPLVDDRGRVIRPLGARSRNMVLCLLAQALDLAVERKLVVVNVARGKGKRFKEPEPERTFAEPEQVHALLEAADELDRAVPHRDDGELLERRDAGATLAELADEFGLTGASQAHFRLERARAFTTRPGHRRAALVAMAGAGLRASEVCHATVRDYDPVSKTLRVRKSKTDAGRRAVHLSDWVCEELDRYLQARGSAPGTAPLFPAQNGSRRDRNNVRERVVRPVRERADELLRERGQPPLPEKFTPHSLRRTWFTMMYEAKVPGRRIADQGGHKDPTTGMRIYNQSLKARRREDEAAAFDALMRPPR